MLKFVRTSFRAFKIRLNGSRLLSKPLKLVSALKTAFRTFKVSLNGLKGSKIAFKTVRASFNGLELLLEPFK